MPYPDVLPFAEIKRIAGYFKEGTVKENIKQAAYDLYMIQGYVFGTFIGQPPSLTFGADSTEREPEGNLISVNVSVNDKQVLAELVCLEAAGLPQVSDGTEIIPVFQTADGNVGKLDITKIMEIALKIYEMLVMFNIIPKPTPAVK